MIRIVLTVFIILCSLVSARGQMESIAAFHEAAAMNSGKIQQEMIYLHLDNTSYYRGDRLYFAGYLVTASRLTPSTLSQTVYVELLNPGGKIIDRCVLKPHLGRFHGSLLVDETPFYSGYYEIRAYTRYMLNFGEEAIYSRTIPVFREPKTEGDWADRSMLEYGSKALAFDRPKPEMKNAKLNARFFPEGGHLVSGLESTVAFEIYDESHRPTQVSGIITDSKGTEIAAFQSGAMGRGSFSFTPDCNEKYRAEIIDAGKRYLIDLPKTEKEGAVLHVSAAANEDAGSVEITIGRTPGFSSDMQGVSFSCRGRLCFRAIVDLSSSNRVSFKVPRSKFPTGVIQTTLFDSGGNVLADRLFFNNKQDFLEANYVFNKDVYAPFEPVEFEVNLTSALTGMPRNIPFAISVTDAENEIDPGSNMLADLLLASEIKGYVYRPAYYFEQPDDPVRQRELDELLMVQGWRRYNWEYLTGLKEYPITSMPERGIEVNGLMLSSRTNKPQSGVGISALFYDMSEATTLGSRDMLYDSNVTDSLGCFAINAELSGNWMMTLTANNKKGDLANHRILLDHSNRPGPRAYDPGELQCEQRSAPMASHIDSIAQEDEIFSPKSGNLLKEIEVIGEANRYAAAQYIDNATVSYDISAARNILQDRGQKYIRHLSDLLPLIDDNFFVSSTQLTYKGKEPIFVLDKDMGTNSATAKYNNLQPALAADIPLYMIKNVYVSNKNEAIIDYGMPIATDDAFIESCKFIDPSARRDYVGEILKHSSAIKEMADSARVYGGMLTEEYASKRFGCVVFLELISSHREKIQPGMRRTVIEGYTTPVEFYSPDYSDAPPLPDDRRRTLYWNPNAIPGRKLRFHNNATPSRLRVTITALDPTGHILR